MRSLPFLILLAGGAAYAQSARFEASVPSENVTLDQTVELTVTLERDGQQAFESYRAPATPDFDVLHAGTSEQVNMAFINGRQSVRMCSSSTSIFSSRRRRARSPSAPPPSRSAAASCTRAPSRFTWERRSKTPPPPRRPARRCRSFRRRQTPCAATRSCTSRAALRLDKPKIYVGEQVTASWRLYTQTDILKYRPLVEPKFEDFWSEDLMATAKHIAWDRQVVNGQDDAVALLMKKGAVSAQGGQAHHHAARRRSDHHAKYVQPQRLHGAPLARAQPVEVKPLPAEGRPPRLRAVQRGAVRSRPRRLIARRSKPATPSPGALTLRGSRQPPAQRAAAPSSTTSTASSSTTRR